MENEIWKDIEGWEGLYCISNKGNVKSLDRVMYSDKGRKRTVRGRILVNKIGDKGYHKVNLARNGKVETKAVHRLVAEAFIPNPENKDQINHWNGIKTDNRVENILWSTSSENNLHAHRVLHTRCSGTGRSGVKNPNSKPVIKCSLNGDIIEEYPCIEWAAKSVGCTGGYFSSVCNGRLKTQIVRGYIWKFKHQDNE